MVKLETLCNECAFYSPETSCTLGKLEKFKNVGADIRYESDGPVINRVCMFNRPFSWSSNKTLSECEEQVKEEVYLCGTILLVVDDIADLERSLDVLKDVDRIDRFRVIINHSDKISKELMESLTKSLDFEDYLCMMTFIEDIDRRIYEGFLKSKNGMFIVIDASKVFEKGFVDKINNMLNVEMLRVGHIEPIDGYHLSATPSLIYKYLHGNAEKPISEKFIELGDESMVFTWKDVDEKYKN